MSSIMDFHEIIDEQNIKSKEILQEYERLADEKRQRYKKEANDILNKNKLLQKEIHSLKEEYDEINKSSLTYNEKYEKRSDIDEKIEELENQIEKNSYDIDRIESRDIYPHGNGIFGFALEYYNISKKINVEWKDSIFTYTILGYKRVYPEDATNYIQYQEDIKTSSSLMKDIQNSLTLKRINYRELFWSDWVEKINEYLKENNITIDDNIVFRPIIHDTMIMDKDKLEYYRMTKNDLEETEEENDEIDMMDYFLYSG